MKVTAARRRGLAHSLTARHHTLVADEPASAGGGDSGPTPEELLALSLASCTAITVEMYAERKGWDVGRLTVRVDHESGRKGELASFSVTLGLPSALSDEQVERIREIAGKCPVHRTLIAGARIEDRVERVDAA